MATLETLPAEAVELFDRLRGLGIVGVDTFVKKLRNNAGDPLRVTDLLSEGYAAATFAEAGFQVSMADAPDLWLARNGVRVGAEVKHFRRKEQDNLDGLRLANAIKERRLVVYGDPQESGETGCGWEQVFRKADEAARKFHLPHPFILVIHSDSDHCVEEHDVMTAVHEINDRLRRGRSADRHLSVASGLMLLSGWTRAGEARNTYFFEVLGCAHPFPQELTATICNIRKWRRSVPLAA